MNQARRWAAAMVATPIAMEAAKAHVHPIVLKDVLVVEPHVTVVVP